MATVIENLPVRLDYVTYQGDTFSQQVTIKNNGTGIDFTGYTAKMELRNAVSNDVALTLTTGSGVTMSNAGVVTITMTATQTDALPAAVYNYDLQTTSGPTIKTYLVGTITISADTTAN